MSDKTTEQSPYVQVGNSGLFVYKVGLGTMQFGWSTDEKQAHDIMSTYTDHGGNFIDTADCYSSWAGNEGGPVNEGGVSEEIIGRWMAACGNRDNIVLATKVRAAMGVQFSHGRTTFKQREGLSRRWITQACEDSLRRLKTDYIDLYQAHFIDPLVPIEETLSIFSDLIRQGKVRYVGCSNFSAWRLMEALWASQREGFERFISLQPEYSLASPTRGDFETELAPVCERYSVGVIPYSPLAAGLLTGKYQRDKPLPDSVRAAANSERKFSEKNWQIIDCLTQVAEEANTKPANAAIAWLHSKPWVTAPIIGANSTVQLSELLNGLDTELSDSALQTLNEVSDFRRSRTHLEQ